jgi:opacity protein-like surface antigen
MRTFTSLALVSLSLVSTPTLAMDNGQTYIAVQGGLVQPESHDFLIGSGAKVTTNLKDGYVVVGAIGRKVGQNIRAEIEGSYREAEVENHSTTGPALAGSVGENKVTAGMVNAYYDVPTSTNITPYIGLGVGVAHVDYQNYGTTATGTVLDDSETVFAYQGIAGLSTPLTARLSLNAEYRYFATADVEVESSTRKSDTDYKTHNFLVGARYAF